ncbi:hypothetical protein HMPREF9946_04420, partial [Acetobacteraceae bacterium AT-5844]
RRLQALALTRAKQAPLIEQRPGPARLAADYIQERCQPAIQVSATTVNDRHPRLPPHCSAEREPSASLKVPK